MSSCVFERAWRKYIRSVILILTQPTVRASIFSTVLLYERLLATEDAPSGACLVQSAPADPSAPWTAIPVGSHQPMELLDASAARCNHRGAQQASANVTGALSAAVHGTELNNQPLLDEKLWAADITVRKTQLGGNAILACSLGLVRAGAVLSHSSVVNHVLKSFDKQRGNMATPVIPLLQLARSGKVKIGGVSAYARQAASFAEGVAIVASIHAALRDILAKKDPKALGVMSAASGAWLLSSDKLDSVWDLLNEAISAAGLSPATVALVVDCSASNFFDAAKQKYDMVVGTPRTADELATEYTELLKVRPVIRGFIDPFRIADVDAWFALRTAVADTCQLFAGDSFESNPESAVSNGNPVAHAQVMRLSQVGTVSRLMAASDAVRAAGSTVVVTCSDLETGSSILADLSVAAGASMVFFGAPLRERTALYNRMAEIEQV